jgi:hypothetical protein
MQTADAVVAFLQDQKKAFAVKKVFIASGYIPQDMTTDSLYIDVLPDGCRSSVERIRRQATGHENATIRILVRKRLPEKVGKDTLDTLVSLVECLADLLLNAQWSADVHCSSVDLSPLLDQEQLAKGLFSSTAVVHLTCQWDL